MSLFQVCINNILYILFICILRQRLSYIKSKVLKDMYIVIITKLEETKKTVFNRKMLLSGLVVAGLWPASKT